MPAESSLDIAQIADAPAVSASEAATVASLRAAMSHPVRLQILSALAEEGPPLSAADLAARLELPVRSVRYQVSKLAAEGLVEATATRERRGAWEKLYEARTAPILDSIDFDEMTADLSRRAATEVFRRIIHDVGQALEAGSFDRNDSAAVRVAAEVDEQGWSEIAQLSRRAYEEIEAVKARTARRIASSQEESKLGISVLFWFERPGPRSGVRPSALGGLPHPGARPGEEVAVRDLAAAMGHPVRARILFALSASPPLGVGELTERVREPEGKVRYHLRSLVGVGLVKAIDGARRSRRYTLLVPPLLHPDELAALSGPQSRRIWTEVLRRVFADAVEAISAGALFRRHDFIQVRVPLATDAAGWEEIQKISLDAYEQIGAAGEAAATRLQKSGDEPIPVTAAILWFEGPTA